MTVRIAAYFLFFSDFIAVKMTCEHAMNMHIDMRSDDLETCTM